MLTAHLLGIIIGQSPIADQYYNEDADNCGKIHLLPLQQQLPTPAKWWLDGNEWKRGFRQDFDAGFYFATWDGWLD